MLQGQVPVIAFSLLQGQVPIIFLPGHKSHMDYILMSFVLANIGITVPHIASGDNLSLWGIGCVCVCVCVCGVCGCVGGGVL